jgi:hypothetical protein
MAAREGRISVLVFDGTEIAGGKFSTTANSVGVILLMLPKSSIKAMGKKATGFGRP